MNVRLLTGGAVLICAGLLYGQADQKKSSDDTRQVAASSATQEAERQGRVALTPNAQESPSETLQQAIAFERYKDMAAERQAQKEAGGTAESSSTVKRTATRKR